MDARGRHLFQIVDMLGAAKLDFESLKLPEDDGSVFRGELLVLAIVIQNARQDGIVFLCSKLFKCADAGFQLHLLGQLGEVTLCLGRRQASAFLDDRHIELKYAVGVDPKRRICIVIGDLEVVAKILLTAELTGFDGLFVIDRVVGERPLFERSRLGFPPLKAEEYCDIREPSGVKTRLSSRLSIWCEVFPDRSTPTGCAS